MNSATEMKLGAPLDRHVLPVRCVVGADTVIHEAPAELGEMEMAQ